MGSETSLTGSGAIRVGYRGASAEPEPETGPASLQKVGKTGSIEYKCTVCTAAGGPLRVRGQGPGEGPQGAPAPQGGLCPGGVSRAEEDPSQLQEADAGMSSFILYS